MGKLIGALYPCIADMTDLLRVEQLPLPVVELVVEIHNKLGVDEVEKSVAHIAIVLHQI